MRFRKTAALLAGVMICAATLGGCASRQVEEVVADTTITMKNDGRQARLVLAHVEAGEEQAVILREIADKYEADFPNTEIEIRSYDTYEALASAENGTEQADIIAVDGEKLVSSVEKGELLDIYEYIRAWSESATLTLEAKNAVGAMGERHAYIIPYDFDQKLMFYRADWFAEYNEGKAEADMAWCRSWDQIERTNQYLGDKGMLAFAGKTQMIDCFDAMVWSTLGLRRVADPAAAYYSVAKEGGSVFSLEMTAESVARFQELMGKVVIPQALNWTEEEAIDAFVEGEAGMLLADRSTADVLSRRMPEGSWDTEGPPRGTSGAAVFSDKALGWGISSATEEEEIAAHFLTFLCNADNNTHFAKVCGTMPIHLEAQNMEASLTEGDRAREMEMISKGDWYQYASEPLMYKAHKGYRESANEKLRQLLSGDITGQELLEDLDGYWTKAYIEEGKLWE